MRKRDGIFAGRRGLDQPAVGLVEAVPDAAGDAERERGAGFGPAVHAIYDDGSRTIYLPEDWTGATPAEVSLLVHEMVHICRTPRD